MSKHPPYLNEEDAETRGRGDAFCALVPNLLIGNALGLRISDSQTVDSRGCVRAAPKLPAGCELCLRNTPQPRSTPPESEIRRHFHSQSGDWERARVGVLGRRYRAFVLLETMIGVFVFAVGVLSLAKCVDQCLNAETAKAADQRARLALENRMAEIEAGAVNISKPKSDELKGMFKGMTITQSRTEVHQKNENKVELIGLYLVNLEVVWKESNQAQSKALRFYVYQP